MQPCILVMSAESVALFAEASVMEETIIKFTNLSEEEFAYAKEEFDSIDKDGSGTLDKAEVAKWLESDAGVSEEEVREYLKQFDKDGDGTITLIEFLQASGYQLKK